MPSIFKDWRKRLPVIVAFVVLAAISGIIGNRADAFTLAFWKPTIEFLASSSGVPVWLLILSTTIALASMALAFHRLEKRSERRLRPEKDAIRNGKAELQALEHAISLVELDDTLLRLLPLLADSEDLDTGMHRLITEFFRDATAVFEGDVSRGMVLHVEGSELVAWFGYQMPPETMKRTRFSLGDPSKTEAGVALRTFRTGKLEVVHFRKSVRARKTTWRPDSRAYKTFDGQRPHPPYQSFVTVAVRGHNAAILGVVCFDSMNVGAFDPPEIQQFLQTLARRIGASIQIHEQIRRFREQIATPD